MCAAPRSKDGALAPAPANGVERDKVSYVMVDDCPSVSPEKLKPLAVVWMSLSRHFRGSSQAHFFGAFGNPGYLAPVLRDAMGRAEIGELARFADHHPRHRRQLAAAHHRGGARQEHGRKLGERPV
jgi:hypothetical protein